MRSPDEPTVRESVSAVIATYNRPDALVTAIRSVQAQTHPVHEIIVVGDCCDADTAIAIAEIDDARIRFVNLSERHGDQSFPNSIGVELATGSWVAFLNHDDVWFPQHLETLVSRAQQSRRQWVCGSANFSSAVTTIDGKTVPVVTERALEARSLWAAFGASLRYLEPASSWLVSREGLRRAGNWQSAGQSVRTPLSHLGLRLWRALGPPEMSEEISVLKVQGALQQILGGEYTSPSAVHRNLATRLAEDPRGWFRTLPINLSETTSRRAPLESNWPDSGVKPLSRPVVACCAVLFLVTGFDFLEWRLRRAGVRPGELMDEILKGRTGEDRVSWKPHRRKGRGDDGN
jgi:hypothetical protein